MLCRLVGTHPTPDVVRPARTLRSTSGTPCGAVRVAVDGALAVVLAVLVVAQVTVRPVLCAPYRQTTITYGEDNHPQMLYTILRIIIQN